LLLSVLKSFAAGLHPRVRIGRRTRIAPSARIKAGKGRIVIGKYCRIRSYAILASQGGQITLGDYVSINPFSVLYGRGGLRIGSNVLIAAHVTIIPANHLFDRTDELIRKQGERAAGITIGDDVWIGTGARILDGVTIGHGSVVAAGSVVTKDVQPFNVVAGAPAKFVRRRGERGGEGVDV